MMYGVEGPHTCSLEHNVLKYEEPRVMITPTSELEDDSVKMRLMDRGVEAAGPLRCDLSEDAWPGLGDEMEGGPTINSKCP
jgi:hypothetical protein